MKGESQQPGTGNNSVGLFPGQIPGGIDSDGISGVNACPFNMFHNTRNEYVLSITDGIHLKFRTHQIFVDQNQIVLFVGKDNFHIFPDVVIGKSNDHILAAKNITWPHENRVTKAAGDAESFLCICGCITGGSFDIQLFQQSFKTAPVLCSIDAVGTGSKKRHSLLSQEGSQTDGSLPSECGHYAHGLFNPDNIHHIIRGQRFEIKAVGSIKVCGYGFRVVVDNDNFTACLFQRPYTVNTGVIKFNALTDTDRAGAKYDNDRFFGPMSANKGRSFVLFVVSGIKIRSLRFELSAAGIHHFVGGRNMRDFLFAAKPADCAVRKAVFFGLQKKFVIQRGGFQFFLYAADVFQFIQKPLVHHCHGMESFHTYASAKRFIKSENTLIVLGQYFIGKFLIAFFFHFRHGKAVQRQFCSPHSF